MATDPGDEVTPEVRDPFRRKLLLDASEVASGAPNSADIRIPTLFADQAGLDASRQAITDRVGADLEEDFQAIQSRALTQGRLRSGLVSKEETGAALRASVRNTAELSNFELQTRNAAAERVHQSTLQREGAQQTAGIIETQGIEDRAGISAQGAVDTANIRTSGEETRRNINTQKTADTDVISAEGAQARETIGTQSAANIAETAAGVEAQSEAELDAIREQGQQDRSTLGQQAGAQIRAIREQGTQDRMTQTGASNSAERVADIQAAASAAVANIQANASMSVADKQAASDKVIADASAASALAVAQENATSGKTIAEIAAGANVDVAQLGLDATKARINSDYWLRQLDQPIEIRRIALEELREANDAKLRGESIEISRDAQEAQESLDLMRLSLDAKMVDNQFKVDQAELTGIWEVYGPRQLEEFQESFGTTMGEDGYDGNYDFDSNGTIDHHDFLQLAEFAAVGGIETQAAKQLAESTRQFNLTFIEGQEQFDDALDDQWAMFEAQLDNTISQQGLDREQARVLTIATLKANVDIQNAGLDVNRMAIMADLLSGPGGTAMAREDKEAAIDFIMGFEALGFEAPQRSENFNEDEEFEAARDVIREDQGLGDDEDLDSISEDQMTKAADITKKIGRGTWDTVLGVSGVSDTYDRIFEVMGPAMNDPNSEGARQLREHFDVNGDGQVDQLDKAYALAYG